jgi:hypothetical protein
MTLAGANAGSVDDMTDTSPQNPKGFFELKEMRQFCDDVLFNAEADWWKVASLSLARVPHDVTRSAVWRAKRIIARLEESGPCIIKEPRLCLALPVFVRATENPVVIHIVRNPVEVALSLRTRNGFGVMQGLALWEAYNRAAIINSEGLPYVKISYRDLLEQPVATLAELVDSLSSMGIEGLHQPEEGALKEFVTGSLRHERTEEGEIVNYLTQSQLALWQQLRDQPRIEIESLPPASDALNDTLIDLEANVRRIEESKLLTRELSELKKSLADRFAEISQMTELLLSGDEKVEQLTKRFEQDLENRKRLERDLEKQRRHGQELLRARERLDQDLLKSRKQHEQQLLESRKRLEQQVLENRRLRQQARILMFRRSLRSRLGARYRLIRKQTALIESSDLFDESWYEREYPDVKETGCRPAEHYLLHGAYEGRNPGPNFNSSSYLDNNPDVEEQGVNPLIHYLEYGQSEKRINR